MRSRTQWHGLAAASFWFWLSSLSARPGWAQNPPLVQATPGPVAADELINKKSAMQHFQIGKDLHLRKLFRGAIREYQKALLLNPNWVEARQALLWARRDLRLQQKLDSRNTSTLPGMVAKAQEYYARGQRLQAEGNPVEATLAYKSALELLPNYPEAKQALQATQQQTRLQGGTDFRRKRLAENAAMAQLQPQRPHAAAGKKDTLRIKEPSVGPQVPPTQMPMHLAGPSYLTRRASPPDPPASYLLGSTAKPTPPESSSLENNITQAIQTHFLSGCQALDNGDFATAMQEFELVLEFMPTHKKAAFKLAQARERKNAELLLAEQQAKQAAASGDQIGQMLAVKNMASIAPEDEKIRIKWEQTKKANQGLAEKLYRQGVTAYIEGNYPEALKNWELVLDLNPEHKKALESIKKTRDRLLFFDQ